MASPFLGIQTIGSLLTEAAEPIEWVVTGMVPRGGLAFLVARPGAGKSLLAYYLAACVASGTPVLGMMDVMRGAAVYIDLDGRKSVGAMRAAAALRGLGIADHELPSLPLYVAAQRSSMDMRLDEVVALVLDELAAVPNLAFVVLDTWSDLHHGKEQSPDDMTDTARGAVEIAAQCNCGVLVVHHARKNGTTNEIEDVRGASSITAKADSVFILKTERDDDGDPGEMTLLQRKARLTEEARPRKFRLIADGDVEGGLASYRYEVVSGSAMGRPADASKEAEAIAQRLLDATPNMIRAELVRELMAAHVAQATAYRVAGRFYQKPPNPGVPPLLIKHEPIAIQGEMGGSAELSGGASDKTATLVDLAAYAKVAGDE